jgi:hypothetical protein
MSRQPTVHFEYEDGASRSRILYQNGDSEQLLLSSLGSDLHRLEESSFAGDAVCGDTISARKL